MNRNIFKIIVVLAVLIGLLAAKLVFFPSIGTSPDSPPIVTPDVTTSPDSPDPLSDPALDDGQPIDLRPAENPLREEMRDVFLEQALMSTIADKYPTEFEQFLDRMMTALDAPNPEQAAFDIGRTFTTYLRHANAHHAVNTPDSSLRAVFDNHLKILSHLKETHGPDACATFAQSGVNAPDLASWNINDAAQENARLTLLSLADARDNPQPHDDTTVDDVILLQQAMLKLGTPPEKIDAYFGDTRPLSADDCDLTINMIKSFSQLPASAAGRFMAAQFADMIAS